MLFFSELEMVSVDTAVETISFSVRIHGELFTAGRFFSVFLGGGGRFFFLFELRTPQFYSFTHKMALQKPLMCFYKTQK